MMKKKTALKKRVFRKKAVKKARKSHGVPMDFGVKDLTFTQLHALIGAASNQLDAMEEKDKKKLPIKKLTSLQKRYAELTDGETILVKHPVELEVSLNMGMYPYNANPSCDVDVLNWRDLGDIDPTKIPEVKSRVAALVKEVKAFRKEVKTAARENDVPESLVWDNVEVI